MNIRPWIIAGATVTWFVLFTGMFILYVFPWLYFSLPPVGQYEDPNFAPTMLAILGLALIVGIIVSIQFLVSAYKTEVKKIRWYTMSVLRYSSVVVGSVFLFSTLSLYKGVIDGTAAVNRIAIEEQCPDFLHQTGGELDCIVYPAQATTIRAKILTGFYEEFRWSVAYGALLGHTIGLLIVSVLAFYSMCSNEKNDLRKTT